MAIQWKTDSNKELPLAIIEDNENGYGICELDSLHENKQANAALICDAVNNTAGKGIDPNAVPEIIQALKIASYALRKSDKLSAGIVSMINKAIKSAELK